MMILINGFDVFVQKDDPERGCDPYSGFHRGDRLHTEKFDSVEALNAALADHGLPPLVEWEESDDFPGDYHTSKSEDKDGLEITDDEFRTDPERGLYLVDYTVSVSVVEPRPLRKAELEAMA